tara:strand:- start:360 stop:560 length:201 start_codon:yes stop_codon:yes gene_type:complete
MSELEYWEQQVDRAESSEEFSTAIDGLMSHMVDEGWVSMSWDDKKECIIFFMTPEQKRLHDMTHPG